MTERGGKGLGWVAEKEFDGKAADLNISAADGVKQGGWCWKGSREHERCR